MRVNEIYCRVSSNYIDPECELNDIGTRGSMSKEDRERVRTLEFPKTMRLYGKTYKVTRIWFNNRDYVGDRTFPNLKKVKVPKELEDNFNNFRKLEKDVEIVLY